jgi:hypothetical protein
LLAETPGLHSKPLKRHTEGLSEVVVCILHDVAGFNDASAPRQLGFTFASSCAGEERAGHASDPNGFAAFAADRERAAGGGAIVARRPLTTALPTLTEI